jgi:hypothetical protein
MGFDLWTALGISRSTGLALAVAALAFAGLLALRMFVLRRRLRASPRGLSLNDYTSHARR